MEKLLTMAYQEIVVADNEAVVRSGVKTIVEEKTDITVMAGISSASEVLSYCEEQQPPLIVVDCFLFDDGPGFIKAIKHVSPKTHVLVLTLQDSPINIKLALTEGATGYVLKTADEEALIDAVLQTLQGNTYLPPNMLNQLMSFVNMAKNNGNSFGLTDREIEVITYISKGFSNKQIAREMDISVRTVETHRYNLKTKTMATSTSQLVEIAQHIISENTI